MWSRPSDMKNAAAFLDRDGVINLDYGYVHKSEDFKFIPGVFDAMRKLQLAGYKIIVVTNQSGIARGYFTAERYETLTLWMTKQLYDDGIYLTSVYHCPHLPDAPIEVYRQKCRCRKPMPGMIEQAAQDHNIDLAASILFGDHVRDIEAGRAAGVGQLCLIGSNAAYVDLRAAVAQILV